MFNSQFCSVFTKKDMENMPDKGQLLHRVMPTINISLNGVIRCVKSLNPGEMPTSYLSSRRAIEPNPPIIDQLA